MTSPKPRAHLDGAYALRAAKETCNKFLAFTANMYHFSNMYHFRSFNQNMYYGIFLPHYMAHNMGHDYLSEHRGKKYMALMHHLHLSKDAQKQSTRFS